MSLKVSISKKQRTLLFIASAVAILLAIVTTGIFIGEQQIGINLDNKNSVPSIMNLFGTDWLGRDMFARTIKGLSLSMAVGILAAFISTIIALTLSVLASWNIVIDRMVTGLIDLFLSVPHLVLLLLISFACGGGYQGVIIGLALTHWPSLTRVLRAEMMQINRTEYVGVSRQLGKSKLWTAKHHMLPHISSQLVVGFLLLFPHAILHEAAITFLGFGLPPEQPAIGIILSESMRYLSVGMWWLAFFPGLSLLIMVGLFDLLGKNLQVYLDPFNRQK
ncbi:ABC transporter permease [Radiobacillus sp. PE A8.2]|uniref:ABC transporter permease n=1 Tax=Radiobacillus sp. PE A8.2 TaxID=3380349 RepID=UPI00388D7A88